MNSRKPFPLARRAEVLRRLVLSLVLVLEFPLQAANVLFNLADFTSGSISNRTLQITPLLPPRIDGGNIITGDRRSYSTDGNGSVTVLNVVYGYYLCQIQGPYMVTSWTMLVPGTNSSTLNANTLIMASTNALPGIYAYSQAASDARYLVLNGTNSGLTFYAPIFGNAGGVAISTNFQVYGCVNIDTNRNDSTPFAAGTPAINFNHTHSLNYAAGTLSYQGDDINAVLLAFNSPTGMVVIAGATNFISFGATNLPPGDTATPVGWVSVKVNGLTNAFRLPLYQ